MDSPGSPSDDEAPTTAPGSPHGHDEANGENGESKSKHVVRKDRACPFCKQIFTSSSLGRHLDFFIRDKRPKAPDGIHDVEAIKKIRGTITRRHARQSAGQKKEQQEQKARAESTPKSDPKTETEQKTFPSIAAHTTPAFAQHRPASQPQLASHVQHDPLPAVMHPAAPNNNAPQMSKWTATGVINNLPPRIGSGRFSRILPRPDQQHAGSVIDHDSEDNAHAAELALREVLDTLRQAAAREAPLFDFDFFATSFPGLCLRLLEMPATLYTASPLPTASSLPITGPPTRSHLEAVQEALMERVRGLQNGSSAETQSTDIQRYFNHLNDAYRYWDATPALQQQSVWQLELLRAVADSRRVAELQRELQAVKSQLETVRAQQPTWMHNSALPSPSGSHHHTYFSTPLNLSDTTIRDVKKTGLDLASWDYDRLISKWKPIAQSERSKR